MMQQHIVLAFLWIGFCGLHSLLATSKVKGWVLKNCGSLFNYYRLFYSLFAVVSLSVIIFFQLRMVSPVLYKTIFVTDVISSLLLVAGAIVMVICIRKYFINLSGVKSLYTGVEKSNRLRIDGIHKYVRHPLYTGTFLTIWGAAGLWPYLSFFIANVIITAYTVYAIKWEEQKLIAEFGDGYVAYKESVPKLFPFMQ